MKKMVVVADDQPYSRTTVWEAYKALAKTLNLEFVSYEMVEAKSGLMHPDRDVSLFLAETAIIKISMLTIPRVRKLYPNAKVVALGGDTLYYKRGFGHCESQELLWDKGRKMEFFSPYDVDLFLDLIDEVVEDYLDKGINAEGWAWTTSGKVVDYCLSRWQKEQPPKTNDLIALFTLNGPDGYRRSMIGHLFGRGYKIIKTGMVGYGEDELYQAYSSSLFTLGTTSPSWTHYLRTMKGFRDWIGPCCGSVLLYDNHPDVLRKFPEVVIYPYGKFDKIEEVMRDCDRESTLARQQAWIKENVIEKQLYRLLKKHRLVAHQPNAN